MDKCRHNWHNAQQILEAHFHDATPARAGTSVNYLHGRQLLFLVQAIRLSERTPILSWQVLFAYFIIIHGKDPAPFNILVVRVIFEIHKVLCHCVIESIRQVLQNLPKERLGATIHTHPSNDTLGWRLWKSCSGSCWSHRPPTTRGSWGQVTMSPRALSMVICGWFDISAA